MTAKKPTPPSKAASPAAKAKPAAVEPKKKAAPAAKAADPVAKGKGAVVAKGVAAKKGKGDDKAAKPEASDVDLSDLEADLEGEPVVVEADVAAKAKPLRMKVSRAKERALMREFGLDETQLTEEEVAKRRQELKTLIKMGKTRGFLTHQEINDHLPEKLVDHEILEAIVSMLNDMGIAVYEQAPDAATLLIAGGGATTAT
jgi:RNA polymerase primary sigma factor